MPDMKRNFTSGKMNKDLDERLVPKGEYRDGMNIQVATSEGSDVGTIQNILGNIPGCTYEQDQVNPIPIGSTTVGSISDEKNDTLYWLIAGPTYANLTDYIPLNAGETISFKDMIMRTSTTFSLDTINYNGCEPVFVDKYAFCTSYIAAPSSVLENSLTLSDASLYSNITSGMNAVGYDSSGNAVWGSITPVTVTNVGEVTTIPVNYISGQTLQPTTYTSQPQGSANPINPTSEAVYLRTFQNPVFPGRYDQIHNDANNINNQSNLPPTPETAYIQLIVSPATGMPLSTAWTAGAVVNSTLFPSPGGLFSNAIIHSVVYGSTCVFSWDIATNGPSCNQNVYIVTLSLANGSINMNQLPAVNTAPWGNFSSMFHYEPLWTGNVLSGGDTSGVYALLTTNVAVPNNVITISPSSTQWLDEINTLINTNGETLEINNTIGAGIYWPPNSCIDSTSVSAATGTPPVYDLQFDIINCVSGVNQGPSSFNTDSNLQLVFNVQSPYSLSQVNINTPIDLSLTETVCFTSERVLNFNSNRLITGINIVDDMLFWTDNFTEPKKINIPRSVIGTDSVGDTHTAIINTATGLSFANYSPIREEHITVIRKGPKNALLMDLKSSRNPDLNYSGVVRISQATTPSLSSLWDQRVAPGNAAYPYDFSSLSTENGYNTFKAIIPTDLAGNTTFNLEGLELGSKVVLKEFDIDGTPPSIPISDYTIKGTIVNWDYSGADANSFTSPSGTWGAKLSIKVSSISRPPQDASITTTGFLDYAIDLFDEDEKLFEFKFPRFSYRYKFEDGEYSTFAPWTSVAFLPGSFDYHPNKGYNLGMTNSMTHLYLRNFINQEIPLDVVEVDLLYKDDASPSVYVVETIRADAEATIIDSVSGVSSNVWNLGEFKIDKENIKAILPSNQLLRPWDNVPKKALAQDVTGNRVVYGNYEQNYNLTVAGQEYTPKFEHNLANNDYSITSIKSLREYQLGIVFTDEYGRETPVISNNSGTFKVPKEQAKSKNKIQARVNSAAIPPNMKFFKFYIKETSGEYYNMAMDRYWDAEDGNVWISFASTDRNKIDIDSFLILKKGVDSSDPVHDPGKFKVIAIENEAPDFIKTNKTILSDVAYSTIPSANIFQGAIPSQSSKEFDLAYWDGAVDIYSNTAIKNIHKELFADGDIYFQLQSTTGSKSTKPIRVVKIDIDDDNWDNTDGLNTRSTALVNWRIVLEEPFGSQVNQHTNDSSGANSTTINTTTRAIFWRYKVENSLEFNGRFFVKIFNDDTFYKYIIQTTSNTTYNFSTIVDQKIYSFDKTKHSKAFNNASGLILNGSERVVQNSANATERWNDDGINGLGYLERTDEVGSSYGNSGTNWRSHAAFFRGNNVHSAEESFWLQGPHGRNKKVNFDALDIHSSTYWSSWNYEDVWFIDAETSVGKFSPHWSNPPNPPGHTGIGLNTTTKQIELGFGGIQPQDKEFGVLPWELGNQSNFGADTDFFDLTQNELYKNTSTGANRLSSRLVAGSYFRWKEDPTEQVFKMTGASNFQLARHESQSGNVDKQIDAMLGNTSYGYGGDVKYRTSTYFRPDNYSKNYKFGFNTFPTVNTPIIWDPYTSGKIANGLNIPILVNTGMLVGGNSIVVATTSGVDLTYNLQSIKVGMVYDFLSTGIGGAVISKIVLGTGTTATIFFKNYDATVINPVFPAIGNNAIINFEQFGMNGISRNSALNINRWSSGKGFSDTNEGVDAVGYTLEILEVSDQEAEFPRFPAIFETEPKEITELDIYHEMTDNNPTFLDASNIGYVLPNGSQVTVNADDPGVGDNGFLEGTVASTSWGLATGDTIMIAQDWSVFTPSAIVPGDELTVQKPNGDILSFEIISIQFVTVPVLPPFFLTWTLITVSTNLLKGYITSSWHNCYSFGNGVESNRIRDNFNQPYMLNGVKVSATFSEHYKQENRKHGLIYSGIYNSTSGVNNLNQFIQAEKITKDLNPTYGSIQKLHTRDSDLVALCEDKILKILANKDAVFNADGNTNLTATENVLGQTIPFSGEYGISTNPESFASEAYRSYFTDKVRGTIMRLSKDGLTTISDYGMKDWFKDHLKLNNKLIGSYDDRKDQYNITLKAPAASPLSPVQPSYTVTYKESVKGWVSFKSFFPENANSCADKYYSFSNGNLWRHHDETVNRNTFYGVNNFTPSTFNVILNDAPGSVKSFSTINYEGSDSKVTLDLSTLGSTWDQQYYNLVAKPGWHVDSIFTNKETGVVDEFIEKEGKWFNYIKGNPVLHDGGGVDILVNSDGSSSWDQASFAIQGLGMFAPIYGCMDVSATNYDPAANMDDGSCIYSGCTDLLASNYDPLVTIDDGSCIYLGCTDLAANNYDSTANMDDGSCCYGSPSYTNSCAGFIDTGMTSVNAQFNYLNAVDPGVGDDVTIYTYNEINPPGPNSPVTPCPHPNGGYYAHIDNIQLTDAPSGVQQFFTSINSLITWMQGNGMPLANFGMTRAQLSNMVQSYFGNSSSGEASGLNAIASSYCACNPCTSTPPIVMGCMDPMADNQNINATIDDGSCVYTITGCTDSTASNYNATATVDDGGCTYLSSCNTCNFVTNATIHMALGTVFLTSGDAISYYTDPQNQLSNIPLANLYFEVLPVLNVFSVNYPHVNQIDGNSLADDLAICPGPNSTSAVPTILASLTGGQGAYQDSGTYAYPPPNPYQAGFHLNWNDGNGKATQVNYPCIHGNCAVSSLSPTSSYHANTLALENLSAQTNPPGSWIEQWDGSSNSCSDWTSFGAMITNLQADGIITSGVNQIHFGTLNGVFVGNQHPDHLLFQIHNYYSNQAMPNNFDVTSLSFLWTVQAASGYCS